MKKRQLAKPKEEINRPSRKTTGKLSEQYAEILRLRVEIARLRGSTFSRKQFEHERQKSRSGD
jgi:hypothetical protein